MSKEFKSLELEQVDRLELSGIRRRSDGIVEYRDYEFEDWPEKLDIPTANGPLTFRLEETEDGFGAGITPENEDDPVVCLAWYVLDV